MNIDLLTPQAVRKQLKISRQTLWNYVKAGKIPVIRLSDNGKGRMRFRQEDIEKFINDREVK